MKALKINGQVIIDANPVVVASFFRNNDISYILPRNSIGSNWRIVVNEEYKDGKRYYYSPDDIDIDGIFLGYSEDEALITLDELKNEGEKILSGVK